MEEEYLTLAELKNLLEKEKEVRSTLSSEQQAALQHSQLFSKLSMTKSKELIKELMDVPLITLPIAVKITDLMPTQADDVRAILAKERFSLSKEDTDRVLKTVAKYL